MAGGLPEEQDGIPFIPEPRRRRMRNILQFAQHSYHRARINRAVGTLVVEAYISSSDGSLQGPACITDATDRLFELPEHLRLPRISKVQTICYSDRLSAST